MGKKRSGYIDIVGEKFGKLSITGEFVSDKYKKKQTFYTYICDCGNEGIVYRGNLIRENGTRSCGCLLGSNVAIDLTGKRFGKWVAKERIKSTKEKRWETTYLCECDCGTIREIIGIYLTRGHTVNCGCEIIETKRNRKGKDNPVWKGVVENNIALYKTHAPRLEVCEDVFCDPINNEIINVKCAYCGKIYRPTLNEVRTRIRSIETVGNGEGRFYCSDSCKQECPIYHKHKWPLGYKPATSREVQPELRQLTFIRDNYTCVKCGSTDNLHCHHIEGININPLESADIDMCITVCKSCHKDIHKQKDCRYVDLQCKKEGINENIS